MGVVLGTLVLLIGGIFLFTRNGGSSSTNKISDSILVPTGAHETSGIVGGVYQPASSNAKLILVEFGDYECPACGAYQPLTKQLLTDFAGKINYVFRNFPLSQHGNALVSSNAAEAAALQGKFWQMHDKLYESQADWATSTSARDIITGYAKDMGLNITQFNSDLDSQKVSDKITQDLNDGNVVGINQTPTFYINGVKVDNLPADYASFKSIVQDALINAPAPTGTASQAYHIHFDIKTYTNGSPINFSLAKYQESATNPLDPNIHFHDGNGNIIHVHAVNTPLSELFNSLKIVFPSDTKTSTLKLYVNGSLNIQGLSYVPQDLDQILVTYGTGTVNPKELSSVTKDSCIYSLKCPTRGTPPPEDCVGGLGTGCIEQ